MRPLRAARSAAGGAARCPRCRLPVPEWRAPHEARTRRVAAAASGPRSKPDISRKELQKTAQLEYERTFYESADRVTDEEVLLRLDEATPAAAADARAEAAAADLNRELSARLRAASSWGDLTRILSDHGDDLNYLNAALLAVRAGELAPGAAPPPRPGRPAGGAAQAHGAAVQQQQQPRPELDAIGALVLERASWFQAAHFAAAAWGLASAGLVARGFWRGFAGAAERKLPSMGFAQLAAVLCAVASSDYVPPLGWVERAYRQAKKHLVAAEPRPLAQLLWAWGEWGYSPRDRLLVNRFKMALRDVFDQRNMSGRELVMAMHGVARLAPEYWPNGRWMGAFAAAAAPKLASLPEGDVVELLLSLAAMLFRPPAAFVEAALARLRPALELGGGGGGGGGRLALAAAALPAGSDVGGGGDRPAVLPDATAAAALDGGGDGGVGGWAQLEELLDGDPGAADAAGPAAGYRLPQAAAALAWDGDGGGGGAGAGARAPLTAAAAGGAMAGAEDAWEDEEAESELEEGEGEDWEEQAAEEADAGAAAGAMAAAAADAKRGGAAPFAGPFGHYPDPLPGRTPAAAPTPLAPRQLALLAWTLGALDYCPSQGWLVAFCRCLGARAGELGPEELADTLHGLAGIDAAPGPAAARRLLARAGAVAPAMGPEALARTCAALARWGAFPQPGAGAAEALEAALCRLAPRLDAGQAADALGLLACAGAAPPPPALAAAARAAAADAAGAHPAAVAGVIWALARLAYKPPAAVLHEMLSALEPRLNVLGARDLADLAWALCVLRHRPGASWLARYLGALPARAPRMGLRQLADALWALACFGARPDAEWLRRIGGAVAERLREAAAAGPAAPAAPAGGPSAVEAAAARAADAGPAAAAAAAGVEADAAVLVWSLRELGYRGGEEGAGLLEALEAALLPPGSRGSSSDGGGSDGGGGGALLPR
ncbi:hypothetical protein Rsub_02053 [Raphidocelis subcapitata]|uniref:Tbc2 translation factor, chloroplastic n=1 Tax=Raphidocelis subcapitata TaxID=307507 RepID=A0A2V0NPD7_9CHLO|nr:hypothetical protein Rsub_02053 [Raphidocelis subcapitata]|eukprot:GBF89481.1 hypothetical protein Rsub_02053 [Raphidocelis subcapitata]